MTESHIQPAVHHQPDLSQPNPSSLPKDFRQAALSQVIARIRSSLDLETIFQTTAQEIRQSLQADRVGVFQFHPGSGYDDGEFVSESVLPNYLSALAAKIHDHCFGNDYAVHYAQGRIQAIADIHNAGLKDCHVEVLSRFQIRANLIVPLTQQRGAPLGAALHPPMRCTARMAVLRDRIRPANRLSPFLRPAASRSTQPTAIPSTTAESIVWRG